MNHRKLSSKEFDTLKQDKIKELDANVQALYLEFNIVKDKLLHAKQELQLWQQLTYEQYQYPD